MLNLDTAFLQKLASDALDDLFMLARIEGDGITTRYFSLGFRTLEWGASAGELTSAGVIPADRAVYVATDGEFSTKRDTLDSEPPAISLSLTNLDSGWYEELHARAKDYNGARVTFLTVFASVDPVGILQSRLSRIEDGPWLISGYSLDDNSVTFDLGANFDALKLQVPTLLSRARRCQFAYKGEFCRSTSGLLVCNKSPLDCGARHDGRLRFSSWPFSNRSFF